MDNGKLRVAVWSNRLHHVPRTLNVRNESVARQIKDKTWWSSRWKILIQHVSQNQVRIRHQNLNSNPFVCAFGAPIAKHAWRSFHKRRKPCLVAASLQCRRCRSESQIESSSVHTNDSCCHHCTFISERSINCKQIKMLPSIQLPKLHCNVSSLEQMAVQAAIACVARLTE